MKENIETKNTVIDKIKNAFEKSEYLNINKIILFGSYAKGIQGPDSDIDLLIVTNDDFVPGSFAENMELKLTISNAITHLRQQYDIDLIVHTKPMFEEFIKLNSSFKKEILDSGTVIYEKSNESMAISSGR